MIKDLVITDLVARVDDRGYLIELLRNTDTHFKKFGQIYIVGSFSKGTIRAFHKHEVLWDWFFISKGAGKFIFIDDRKDSPTYDILDSYVLSMHHPQLITVPPGVYHGWMALEDHTQLISTASKVYNREHPDENRVSPDFFGKKDIWEVKGR